MPGPRRKTPAERVAERDEQLVHLAERSARRERVLRKLAQKRGQTGSGFRW